MRSWWSGRPSWPGSRSGRRCVPPKRAPSSASGTSGAERCACWSFAIASIPWQADDMRNSIGEYIKEQREQAGKSMRQLAQAAGGSTPYRSQIARGRPKPSADILQQIAKGLRISAEALYVQAGILEDRPADSGVRSALLADPELSERQKQVLNEIYESFRKENLAAAAAAAAQASAPEVAPTAGDAAAEDAPFADGVPF